MKSERLLGVLLLLQARGRATEASLAGELEVSTRTIHRDLEALSAAGVPVYAERGRAGGWALLEGYRTDLSGLTSAEARALLLFGGPGAISSVGEDPRLRSALRKLTSAIPPSYLPDLEAARRRVLMDPVGWGQARPPQPPDPQLFAAVEEAVLSGRRLRFRYGGGSSEGPREVDPIGLVGKAGRWYLLADRAGERRTYRISRMSSAEVLAQPAATASRNVAEEWEQTQQAFSEREGGIVATVLVAAGWERRLLGLLARNSPEREPPADQPGRAAYRLRFPGTRAAAGSLGGFGRFVEAVHPPELRAALADLGGELRATYERPGPDR